MNEHNTYPVFVADQVLTATHLNQVVNYLDEQNRLTRNRLIGIGIVCGLEIRFTPGQIEITKGCGVTSQGYLILQEQKTCTWYRPYSLPEYFSPEYKADYEHWEMWELLSAEESLVVEGPTSLSGSDDFLEDKVVVLLLEMKEKPLKNCVEIDCEDKGDKMEFRVKQLLVRKENLDAFMESRKGGKGEAGNGWSGSASQPGDLKLRRFNVPAQELKNSDDVFAAFLRITNESTLKELAEALNACYERYQPVLNMEHNPFVHAGARFADTLEHIKTSNPFFIQYFYDWIDDIVKGYHELECRIFDVQAVCCPDWDLFPLHLMLGEAPYRHHFIYSPLFNGQKNLLEEVQLLFKRLVAIVETFKVPDIKELSAVSLRITPSRYLYAPLSKRCIPYYYDPVQMYPVWSWEKTRRGKSRNNLSYNAASYSASDRVVEPLNYDIEPFDFFRVEGHIGKPITTALQTVTSQRDELNLPFEITALSTATVRAFFNSKDHECHFRDLEALYQVLLAEMKCKFGGFECMAARVPYQYGASYNRPVSEEVTGKKMTGDFAGVNVIKQVAGIYQVAGIHHQETISGERKMSGQARSFRPGDFLRSHCTVQQGSVGEAWLQAVDNQAEYQGMYLANTGEQVAGMAASYQTIYHSLFYFIHSIEQLFELLMNKNLEELDAAVLPARYQEVMTAVRDLTRFSDRLEQIDTGGDQNKAFSGKLQYGGVYELVTQVDSLRHSCFDERLKALMAEYKRRVRELRILTNLLHYAKKHPGMEHKAGVPKGGTFIMVYHETQRRKYVADQWLHDQSQAMETNMLIRDAYVENPQLVRKFEKALETFMDACNDMKPQERENIRTILTNIPAKEKPLKFQIPDEAVIADFYLPYICCSDCAPISYVLPAPPRETNDPVFDLLPRRFCVKDRNSYDFQIQPFPGKLSEISNPDNLRIIADKNEKTLRFQPARHRIQSTRDFHLEYHGISLDVQVVVPDAGFTMQFLKKGKGRDQLLLQPMQTTASTYKWTILQAGNSLSFNSATVELTAENSEIYMQRKFSISLQINHELPSGNCSDEQEFVMTPELVKKYMDSGEEFDHETGQ